MLVWNCNTTTMRLRVYAVTSGWRLGGRSSPFEETVPDSDRKNRVEAKGLTKRLDVW